MEHILDGVKNNLIYINDVIIHTATHEQHLDILDQTLSKLEQHGLKINLDKCYFGNRKLAYLGYTLTPTGIEPEKKSSNSSRNIRNLPTSKKCGPSSASATSFKTTSRTLRCSLRPSPDYAATIRGTSKDPYQTRLATHSNSCNNHSDPGRH
jgi:hypothetical protein